MTKEKQNTPSSYPLRAFKLQKGDQEYLLLSQHSKVFYSELKVFRGRTLDDLRDDIKSMGLRVYEIDDVGNQPVEVKVGEEWVELNAEVIHFSKGKYKVLLELDRNQIRPKGEFKV